MHYSVITLLDKEQPSLIAYIHITHRSFRAQERKKEKKKKRKKLSDSLPMSRREDDAPPGQIPVYRMVLGRIGEEFWEEFT